MRLLPEKFKKHHMHLMNRHDMALRMDHMIHDERFLPLLIAAILLGAFIAVIIWVMLTGGTPNTQIPMRTFSPYIY